MTEVTSDTITCDELAAALQRRHDSDEAKARGLADLLVADVLAHRGAATVLCPGCLHDGVLERTLERAEAAEATLAGITAYCEGWLSADPCCPEPAEEILAIIGGEGAGQP